ncbi:magnesium/cobalt transporter CorA [Rubrobacter marinus]|uniref:Magnesium transport protein CorA n=1 Tax=Rubrobacter marinus TaxID=2653852 RepID=A0A6G8PYK0_9ACTN|nr:magnesium/cobalt transporter CorA [Rubrobacter marinus]QIN79324.1 magnesium/cobalt transporter CorA [Rubrobacter marinus]
MRTGTEKLPENVELMVLDSSGNLREDVGSDELPGYLSDGDALVWCDVSSQDGGEDGPYVRLLSEAFGFDGLTIEDCFTESHLPKVDDYGEYLFVVLFSFGLSGEGSRLVTAEIDMYVGKNFVVCVHPKPVAELGRVREKLRAGDAFVSASASRIAHTVLDAVVDEYLPIMDALSARADEVEAKLLGGDENVSTRALDDLFGLKHLLTSLRRIALPQRDSVTTFTRPTTPLVPEEDQMYFQDILDHLNRVMDSIESTRDYLSSTMEIYTTRATQRINQGIQKLTAISTVVLPLTLITSVYGMNFENMPELATRYGYFVVLAVLLTIGTIMLYYLHRRRML